MWWAAAMHWRRQVIRDRWCAGRSDTVKHLIWTNADGDPAAEGRHFL